MHRLSQPKAERLEATPIALGIRLVPEADALLGRVDGGPHVFPHPALADQPRLVEQHYPPLPVDLADDVNAPGRQGQAPRGDQWGQVAGQAQGHEAPPHLGRRPAFQRGGAVGGAVPAQEEGHRAPYLGQPGELLTRPQGRDPEAVEGLDLVIALGLVDGDEERLDLAEQAQAHHLAEDARADRPAPEGALVVELLQERPPPLGPGPEQVGPGTGTALVGVLRQADRMAGEVDGVEVLDDPAAPPVLGNDVGGLDGIDFPGDWPRGVGRVVARPDRVGQPPVREYPLDGRRTGQRLDLQPLQLTSDRGCPEQAVARGRGGACFEGLPGRHDHLLDLRGEPPGRAEGGTGMVGEVGVGVALKLAPPLVQPAWAAVEGLTDVADALALQAPPHRRAAQSLFGWLRVHDSSSAEESCEESERCPEREWLLASERCPERANRNDVLSVDTCGGGRPPTSVWSAGPPSSWPWRPSPASRPWPD